MKYRLVALLVGLIGIVGLSYLKLKPENAVHYHAGFQVYVDGVKQDFTDFKYMNFTPCSEHGHKVSKTEEQIEKAHLHDGVGDVVHVHRMGGTWGDLFKNIGYAIPSNKPIIAIAYENGQKITNILSRQITADESVVIIIGEEHNQLYTPVTLDHIKDVESKSELCGTQEHK